MKCPKCGGEMEKGSIYTVGSRSAVWGQGLKLFGAKNSHEINAHRCQKCGYLESYAK